MERYGALAGADVRAHEIEEVERFATVCDSALDEAQEMERWKAKLRMLRAQLGSA